jgi:hypothetical protein
MCFVSGPVIFFTANAVARSADVLAPVTDRWDSAFTTTGILCLCTATP